MSSTEREQEETREEALARRAVDFAVLRKVKHSEEDEALEHIRYWASRSVSERIAAVEELRRQFWGVAYDSGQGLRRDVVIVRRKWR